MAGYIGESRSWNQIVATDVTGKQEVIHTVPVHQNFHALFAFGFDPSPVCVGLVELRPTLSPDGAKTAIELSSSLFSSDANWKIRSTDSVDMIAAAFEIAEERKPPISRQGLAPALASAAIYPLKSLRQLPRRLLKSREPA